MTWAFQIHKLNLNITTNYPDYEKYLLAHFNRVLIEDSSDSANIDIEAKWLSKPDILSSENFKTKIAANTYTAKAKVATTRKIARRKKVQFLFKLDSDRLSVKAQVRTKPFKDMMRYKVFAKPQESFFFELTYPVIYYPLFWYLETLYNTHQLHASAIDINGQGIVICGLEGSGKTSLSLLLAKEMQGRFLADNIVFYDEEKIYPCYEPVRIHKGEDKAIWQDSFDKINQFKTLKDFYQPRFFSQDAVAPKVFIFPVFGDRFCIDELDRSSFADSLLNLNQLTQELGNYNEYSALMNLLGKPHDLSGKRSSALNSLLKASRCFKVCMRKEDGLRENCSKVRDFLIEELRPSR